MSQFTYYLGALSHSKHIAWGFMSHHEYFGWGFYVLGVLCLYSDTHGNNRQYHFTSDGIRGQRSIKRRLKITNILWRL